MKPLDPSESRAEKPNASDNSTDLGSGTSPKESNTNNYQAGTNRQNTLSGEASPTPMQLNRPLTTTEQVPETPVIPGFEIVRELGRGGMGVVYLARQTNLDRLVALKMILLNGRPSSGMLDRFRAEAKALARLQHPNIVQIFDINESDGHPFIVLEYITGGSLSHLARGTTLPPRQAARVVESLARAIAAAHQHGIIHRDLKPANILMAAKSNAPEELDIRSPQFDPVPKITDFGLVKYLHGDSGQTAAGAILGTPSYMAPEQASGENLAVGTASDIYGLGAILYELLTGRPPFRAESASDTLRQVITTPPTPPSQIAPAVDLKVEAICLRCLAKQPSERPASASDLADSLRDYQNASESGTSPPRRKHKPLVLLATAVAVALLAIVGLVVLLRSGTSTPVAGQTHHLDGRPLRHDFPMNVALIGGTGSPENGYTLPSGQKVAIRVQPGRDSHIIVWFHDDHGKVVQLFPNQYDRDPRTLAGKERLIPPSGAEYALRASESRGAEWIHIVASTQEWTPPAAGQKSGPYQVLATPEETNQLQTSLRGLTLEADSGSAAVSEMLIPFRGLPVP